MFSFNIIITELCNANCSHCYMNSESRRGKNTLSKELIDMFVDKLPKNTKRIVFTGGEVLLVKELLIYAIKKVQEKDNQIEIGIESNGVLIYKRENPLQILKELDELNVSFIRFSDDPFHERGGVDLSKVRDLFKYQSLLKGMKIKYLVQKKALSLGKAKNLPDEYCEKRDCMNNENTLTNPYLFVDIDGNIYNCTWKCIPPLGNIFDDEWSQIEKVLQEPFFKFITLGNVERAYAVLDKDNYSDNCSYTKEYGQCALCIKNNCK